MGIIVVACYKPKNDKISKLEKLVKSHYSRLDALNFVTARKPVIGRSADGTFVEVFEWKSKEAIDAAHEHPEIHKMWGEFAEVCDYVPISEVEGMDQMFSELRPLA